MAALVKWLGTFFASGTFASLLVAVCIRILVALGFTLTAIKGLSAGFDTFVGYVSANFSQVPQDIISILSIASIDYAFNVILTAHFFVLSAKGLKTIKMLPTWTKVS